MFNLRQGQIITFHPNNILKSFYAEHIEINSTNFENVKVIDDLPNKKYPMPIISTDTDFTYVGRIRKDVYASNIVHYFNVADQVRVGAATNAVRIGLKWIELESDM